MKTIQVYDPPACCSTGACGTAINPDLVNFSAMLSDLGKQGINIERYNLGQQPMAFAQNSIVKGLLEKDGNEVLPIIIVDGKIHSNGRYPTTDERLAFVRTVQNVT